MKSKINILFISLPLLVMLAYVVPINADAGNTLEFITESIHAASQLTELNVESDVIQDFLKAADLFDGLEEEEKEQLEESVAVEIAAVRDKIGAIIHTCDQVTASSPDWYARTNISYITDTEKVTELLKEKYEGSAPDILYHISISYTDIRDGSDYKQKKMISLSFPVPENYDEQENVKILTISNGTIVELFPVIQDGVFFLRYARSIDNLIIVKLPVALTGIELEKYRSVNTGQKIRLTVTPVPEGTTQSYTLNWKSSNEKVAVVDENGMVTGISVGTAVITAMADGRIDIRAVCTVTVMQGANELSKSLSEVLEETKNYMLSVDINPTIGSEWFVIGLARSGMALDSTYFDIYYNHFANYLKEKKGILTNSSRYTEYSKAILTMTAIGKDARNIDGYNLFESLADFDCVKAQGVNGPIWALIALNCHPDYYIPSVSGVENPTTERKLIDYILDRETPGYGWSLTGDSPDSDITGMALQALVPYYNKQGYEDVTAAVDRALAALSDMQKSTGGYSTMGTETVESCAQVVTALCSLGINPKSDERFVKGGFWTIENLITYHINGSGFMHVKPGVNGNGGGTGGEVNAMATEQGYYALTAYQRFLKGQSGIYDMSDMVLEKGEEGDGKETGLEEYDPGLSMDAVVQPETDLNKNNSETKSQLPEDCQIVTPYSEIIPDTKSNKDSEKPEEEESQKRIGGWVFEAEDYKDYEEESRNLEIPVSEEKEVEQISNDVKSGSLEHRGSSGEFLLFLGGVGTGCVGMCCGTWLFSKKRKEDKGERIISL